MAKYFDVEHTKWLLCGNVWKNVFREMVAGNKVVSTNLLDYCLADYLFFCGFEFDETIEYCLAKNYDTCASIKYRVSGGLVEIFVSPIK